MLCYKYVKVFLKRILVQPIQLQLFRNLSSMNGKTGDTYFNDGWWYNSTNLIKDNTFITKDEAISLVMTSDYLPESNPYEMSEEELDELFADEYSIYSYEKFLYDSYLESYVKHYTTEHGDNIVAFGQYGHD